MILLNIYLLITIIAQIIVFSFAKRNHWYFTDYIKVAFLGLIPFLNLVMILVFISEIIEDSKFWQKLSKVKL